MKTIVIERVSNGWIVRPFSDSCNWARGDQVEMSVFTRIEDLQGALPLLLAPLLEKETTLEDVLRNIPSTP